MHRHRQGLESVGLPGCLCADCCRVTRAVFAALSSTRDCLSDQSATGVLCFIAGADELEEGQVRQQCLGVVCLWTLAVSS
jgi:hypothetical protein